MCDSNSARSAWLHVEGVMVKIPMPASDVIKPFFIFQEIAPYADPQPFPTWKAVIYNSSSCKLIFLRKWRLFTIAGAVNSTFTAGAAVNSTFTAAVSVILLY